LPEPTAAIELPLQAYPNPFTQELRVAFRVEQTQPVSLKLYDSQSREVATLFQAQAEAGKEYKASWTAGQQAGGLYLLRLQTPGKTSTRKVILNR
jgi:hypothetical protein